MEEQILEVIERQPAIRVRCLLDGTSTSHASVHATLKEQQFHPYHIQSMKELEPHNAPERRAFNKYILQK
jgi:hypothetical protein